MRTRLVRDILADAEREVANPSDLGDVRDRARQVTETIERASKAQHS